MGQDRATSYSAPLADLDGDGDVDVVVGYDRVRKMVFLNDGEGHFGRGNVFGRESNTRSITLSDLNGDGAVDILVTNRGAPNTIHLNDGRGRFPTTTYFGSSDDSTIDVVSADVDGDGALSVADTLLTRPVELGPGGELPLLAVVQTPGSMSPGSTDSIAITAVSQVDESVSDTVQDVVTAYQPETSVELEKTVDLARGSPGDVLTYTITLDNPGPALTNAQVTDTLPAEVYYLGNLWASAGSYGEAGGVITWTGSMPTRTPITITFGVTISDQITTPYTIINTVQIDDGLGNVWQRRTIAIANGRLIHMPLILKH